MKEIHVTSMEDCLQIVRALIKNYYIVSVKTVYKPFPKETNIDYFRITYTHELEEAVIGQ